MTATNQPATPPSAASAAAPSAEPTEPSHAEEGVIFNAQRVTQAFVLLASAICFWMFWTVGQWVDFPVEYKHSGSVLFQHNGVFKLIVFWAVLVVASVIATAIASWRWFLAGLFSACLGSSAWAIRGGILRQVLFSASSPGVFLVLAVEQILLVSGVAAMWLVLWRLQERNRSISAQKKPEEEEAPGDPIFAIATQTLAMGIFVLILAATDSAKQVNISVFVAAAAGTAIAQMLQKADKIGKWYWAGPLLVGLIGYLGCYISPRGWDIGQPIGTFAPLARPLPLCYASFGIAGALFGYWMTKTDLTTNLYIGAILFGVPIGRDDINKLRPDSQSPGQ